jgi:hypothetical protein
MTDGTSLDILHPEEVIPLKGTALVARRETSGVPSQPFTTISLLHVLRLEPLKTGLAGYNTTSPG